MLRARCWNSPGAALDEAGRIERAAFRGWRCRARGGEKPCLIEIGLVGLRLRSRERSVHRGQLGGALADRRSSVSLARSSALAAATRSVMSVNVVTCRPAAARWSALR